MKATVEIDDTLLRQTKRIGAEFGISMREMVKEGLQREMKPKPPSRGKIRWVTASGTLPKDLDLSSREKMWEWLESPESDEPELSH